jgi:hypothetical protein
MATTFWVGNAINTPGVDTITVTSFAVGQTLTATINGKAIVYTGVTGDTPALGATGLFNLLTAATAPPEFQELTYVNSVSAVITATEAVPNVKSLNLTGGLVVTAGGGAAVTQTHSTAGSYQSDVNNANNWSRAGAASLPVNGDDVIVADSSVPLLWNLAALAAVQFLSYNRWQSFTAQIGLPENNPNGYVEFRNTYFKFTASGTLNANLGIGTTGGGPSRERYDFGATTVNVNVYAAGSPADDYAVRLLGTAITLNVLGTSVGVAALPGETATVPTAVIDGGGTLAYGLGVTGTTVAVNAGTFVTNTTITTLTVYNGSQAVVGSTGGSFGSLSAQNGSSVIWNSNSTVSTLTLTSGSTFDKSGDARLMTITTSTIDGDSCRILDPLTTITFTNKTLVKGQVTSGPFTFNNRNVQLS